MTRASTRAALAGAVIAVGLGIAPGLTAAAPADSQPWTCRIVHADGQPAGCSLPAPAPHVPFPAPQRATPPPRMISVPQTGGA